MLLYNPTRKCSKTASAKKHGKTLLLVFVENTAGKCSKKVK
jgi:hypothetical protein